MIPTLNFFGLGFELGQEQTGLAESHQFARSYFKALESQGLKISDAGSIDSAQQKFSKLYAEEQILSINWNFHHKACEKISQLLKTSDPLLNWGGDHSVAISTVGAFCENYPEGYVVWIDAHADLNLPSSSLTGNLHGMPLSILLNLENIRKNYFPWIKHSLCPENLIYIGIRDLDPFELETIDKLKIKKFTSNDIKEMGMSTIAHEIRSLVHNKPLHISFDIDAVSPEFAYSTGLHVPNGLSFEDLVTLGFILSNHTQIKSMDVVEINPIIGSSLDIYQTYFTALTFVRAVFSPYYFFQGGIHDDTGTSDQALYTA